MYRCPLPSAGSARCVPLLLRYYEALRLPDTPGATLRLLRLALPRLTRLSLPGDAGAISPRPGVCTGFPLRSCRGSVWASQVPGGPSCARAPFFDPGEARNQAIFSSSLLPSADVTASAPHDGFISRLNHAARALAIYASQPGLPRHHAKLASGWWPPFTGRGLNPQGPS